MQFVITGNGARLTAERQRWQLADNQFQRGTHGTPRHHMAAEHDPVGSDTARCRCSPLNSSVPFSEITSNVPVSDVVASCPA